MRSYRTAVALLKRIHMESSSGPRTGQLPNHTQEQIDGIKKGTLAAVHMIASATADAHGVPRKTMFKDIGIPEQFADNTHLDFITTKFIEGAYEQADAEH